MSLDSTASSQHDRPATAAGVFTQNRVCAAPVPVPFSPPLESAALPDQARILAAIEKVLAP